MQNQKTQPISDRARGRWYGILLHFGIPEWALVNKHGPCPLCREGKDRFRWDDKDGNGTYFCNTCGAGNGFSFLMKFKNWDFKKASNQMKLWLGHGDDAGRGCTNKKETTSPIIAMRKVLNGTKKPKPEGQVDRYLKARGLSIAVMDLNNIMEHPDLFYSSGKSFPAMVGVVQSSEGHRICIHRTFIKNGAKAPVDPARKLMTPIKTINGASIRLFPIAQHIGVGEGIESCIAAFELFGLPVWSVISAQGMNSFIPPKGVKYITFFADNDKNFTGQAAAYNRANRLSLEGLKVNVAVPDNPGDDWLDVLIAKRNKPSTQLELHSQS